MVNDVLPSRMRDGLLARLAGVPLTSLAEIPVVVSEPPTRNLTVGVFVSIDGIKNSVNIVVSLVDDALIEDAQVRVADLSNGTHVGEPSVPLELSCEDEVFEALRVDFIWVVDNSASMQEEQAALAEAAETFFDALMRSRINFRLGVVSTDGEALRGGTFTDDLQTFKDRVQVGINGNGREQGLEFAVRAVQRAQMAASEDARLRDDAVPVVIFYSDEDSSNLQSTEDYASQLRDAGALAFAIVGPRPHGCTSVGRGVAGVGESYVQVVEQLFGSSASICADDLTQPIEEILLASAGAASLTQLEKEPISGSVEVATEASTITRSRASGFDFERTSNSILFFGDAVLDQGTPFRVTYLSFKRPGF